MTEPAHELAPDQEPFFDGGGRGQVLDQLGHLAAWARSLVMLTAPLGGGKTLLLNRVVTEVEQRGNTNIVRPPVGFLSTGPELLRHVAAALGAHVPEQIDTAGLQQLVLQQVTNEVADDRSTLLVLDDAHELSADVLRTVAQLVDDARSSRGLNVLITGEASLREQMAKATPARENWHEIRLRPLPLQELRQFLRAHRPAAFASLDAAGVQTIARRSGGWPGRILSQVDGEVRRQRTFRGRFPLVHLLWLGVMAAALVVVLVMQHRANNKPKVQVAADAPVVESLALPNSAANPASVAAAGATPTGSTARNPDAPGASGLAPAPAVALLPPSQRIPVPKAPDSLPEVAPRPPVEMPPVSRSLPAPDFQLPAAVTTVPTATVTPPGTPTSPAPLTLPAQPPPTSAIPKQAMPKALPASELSRSRAATTPPTVVEPALAAVAASASVAEHAQKPLAVSDAQKSPDPPALAKATQKATAASAPVVPAIPLLVREPSGAAPPALENGWAKQQSPGSYTVQLFGSASLAAAQHFVDTHRAASLRVLHTKKQGVSDHDAGHDVGHDWYVVVLGSFRSRGEAQSAQRQVPGGANNQPWVRTFDGLQKEIP